MILVAWQSLGDARRLAASTAPQSVEGLGRRHWEAERSQGLVPARVVHHPPTRSEARPTAPLSRRAPPPKPAASGRRPPRRHSRCTACNAPRPQRQSPPRASTRLARMPVRTASARSSTIPPPLPPRILCHSNPRAPSRARLPARRPRRTCHFGSASGWNWLARIPPHSRFSGNGCPRVQRTHTLGAHMRGGAEGGEIKAGSGRLTAEQRRRV